MDHALLSPLFTHWPLARVANEEGGGVGVVPDSLLMFCVH